MDLHVYVHFDSGSSADRKLDHLLAHVEQIMSKIDEIREDLATITADLADIKTSVGTTITAQQAQIVDLQTQIAALKAGDVLTEQQLSDLVAAAEAVKVSADETLAAVKPAPVEPPV